MPNQPYTDISQVAFHLQWGDTTEDVYCESSGTNPVSIHYTNTATGNGRLYGQVLYGTIRNSDLQIGENKRANQTAAGWVSIPQKNTVYSVKSCWFSLIKGSPPLREFMFILENPHPFFDG